jgi:hypothetical protein
LVRRTLIGLLYQPRMIDDLCGTDGGKRTGRENRSCRRKPAPVPLCPPQIPYDLIWARNRAAAVGSLWHGHVMPLVPVDGYVAEEHADSFFCTLRIDAANCTKHR